jgi:beta-glucosidase
MHPFVLCLLALATPVFSAPGDGDWAPAYAKAKTALAQLTQANKISMVTGLGWKKGPCVGNTGSVPSIGFPELCLQDSPLG